MEGERLSIPQQKAPQLVSAQAARHISQPGSQPAAPLPFSQGPLTMARRLSLWPVKSPRWCGEQAVMSFLVRCSTAYKISNPHVHGPLLSTPFACPWSGQWGVDTNTYGAWLLLKGNTENLQVGKKPQGFHFRCFSQAKSEVYLPVSHPRSRLKEAHVLPERGTHKEELPGPQACD